MENQPGRGEELLDQPRRQTMSFRSMPAALEADPQRRIMRLVFLVNNQEPNRESPRWCVDKKGRLVSHPPQPYREGPRYFRDVMRAATSISAAVEKAFTGLKFTADWSRWLIHRADGVEIERPTYIEERGTLELMIRVDPDANYDTAYRFVMDVLERQPGYETRGTRPTAFTVEQEIDIERMPKEDEGEAMPPSVDSSKKEAWESAADLLRRF